jgi:flavodoxin
MILNSQLSGKLSILSTACLVALLAAPPSLAQEAAPFADSPFGNALVIVFSQTGKTLSLAETIAAKTGADIYRIETATPLPNDESEIITLENARRSDGRAPELKGPAPDLSPYTFVFVGSPVWFGNLPDHVALFLDGVDFGGRNVALFASAGTRPGEIIQNLAKAVKGGTVLYPGLVNRREDDWSKEALDAMVDEYLTKLGESMASAAAAKTAR